MRKHPNPPVPVIIACSRGGRSDDGRHATSPAPVITSPPRGAALSNERFGFFAIEKETLIIARQLRTQGLKLTQISARLAEMGYRNRRAAVYSECSISRMLNHEGTLLND